MSVYKTKFKNSIKIISIIFLSICLVAILFCIIGIANARFTVDYVSNGFLLVINLIFIFSIINFLMYSNYKLTENQIIIKTAFFKDPVKYEKISKIYYFATEDELYLELNREQENVIKINLKNHDISIFANELKKRIPEIPYEVSLRMDSDLE